MKAIATTLIMIIFSANISLASNHCSATYTTNANPELLEFIKDLNPFWGTWRGTYEGEPVVGELYLDSQARFNIRGSYKDTVLNDRTIRLCYRNGRFQANVSGLNINIEVINSRTLRVTNFLINGSITVQR